jgi:SAM-dependent methyltransferase
MSTAANHYEQLLAEQYTWMLGGDLDALADAQTELLRGLGVAPPGDGEPGEGGTAVDLGCGPGPQALALARLGFASVIAVDTSKALLDELSLHAAGLPAIRPVHADLRTALPEVAPPGTAAAIVCMGDTLPHLPRKADVTALITEIRRALAPGGHLVVTYRDLTRPLEGTERFLPVRMSEDRLLTCFLEYADEDTVLVHDLLHIRSGADGSWSLRTSSYPKLRIGAGWLAAECRAAGLDIRYDAVGPRGMRVLHARAG